MTKRIMVIFGTRPECIKLAPVIAAMRARPRDFDVKICSSGQHQQMLRQAMACFELIPDIELSLKRVDQTLSELTAGLMAVLPQAIAQARPDWIVVQGDTTTTFTASLAAFYESIPVAHVEAGLRSSDRFNPFPEEINRRFVSALVNLHFAPTVRAAEALRREGIPDSRIHLTGNTVVDALAWLRAKLDMQEGSIVSSFIRGLGNEKLILVTCHRRESFGQNLEAISRAIGRVAVRYPAVLFVFPLHLNPKVRAPVTDLLGNIPNVHLINPVPYWDLIFLLSRATLVLSDSGGIQEEAPAFGVPVLVLRTKTERPESIEMGFAELIGVDEETIVGRVSDYLEGSAPVLSVGPNPYGDGHAARRIVETLARVS